VEAVAVIGSSRPAPCGRKRNSGQAALATHGDGWSRIGTRWPQGPFGRAVETSPSPLKQALAVVIYTQRRAGG
jgi:hypothetical protein